MTKEYYIDENFSHTGWCIFIDDGGITPSFVDGPFENKEEAQSECTRLNKEQKQVNL